MSSVTAIPGGARLRLAMSVAGLLGALLLVVATFATVVRLESGRAAVGGLSSSGWDRHGPALLLLAVAAVVLLGVGLRGARVGFAGLAACGLTAVVIALAWDAPDLNSVGAVGDIYSRAQAHAGAGFYLETLGGVLLLAAGGVLLAAAGGAAPGRAGTAAASVAPNVDVAERKERSAGGRRARPRDRKRARRRGRPAR